MYIVFDIETTGLSKDSSILEFAALILDDSFKIIDAVNEYYLYDDVPSSASKINGLTTQKLEFLANKDFYAGAKDIYDLVSRPDVKFIGHNILSFDLPVLKSNLHRSGYDFEIDASRCIDTLSIARNSFPGKHNLEASIRYALAKAECTMSQLTEMFEENPYIQKVNKDKNMQFHSALYDSFVTYVFYMLMTKKG